MVWLIYKLNLFHFVQYQKIVSAAILKRNNFLEMLFQ